MIDERPRSEKAVESGMFVFGTISAKCAKSYAGDCAQWLSFPRGSHTPRRSVYLSAGVEVAPSLLVQQPNDPSGVARPRAHLRVSGPVEV